MTRIWDKYMDIAAAQLEDEQEDDEKLYMHQVEERAEQLRREGSV